MNKEQIIDEVYKNYFLIKSMEKGPFGISGLILPKEEFINNCKTNPEFSEKWGLKIEERELSWEERLELWFQKNQSETGKRGIWKIDYIENYEGHKKLNSYSIPTKLLTLTYKDTKIENYE